MQVAVNDLVILVFSLIHKFTDLIAGMQEGRLQLPNRRGDALLTLGTLNTWKGNGAVPSAKYRSKTSNPRVPQTWSLTSGTQESTCNV